MMDVALFFACLCLIGAVLWCRQELAYIGWALYGEHDEELSCQDQALIEKELRRTERITVKVEALARALRQLDEQTPPWKRVTTNKKDTV